MSQMNTGMCSTQDFYDNILLFLYVGYFSLDIQALSRETTLLHGNKNEDVFLFMLTVPSVVVHGGRKMKEKTVSGLMTPQIRSWKEINWPMCLR